MRILLTGGTGFIGSAFARRAIARGHAIAVLSRSQQPAELRDAKWLAGSMLHPPWDEMAEFQPDVCVHAAWIAVPGIYMEAPENHEWVSWSYNLLTRLADLGVRHFVALGTCIEYQMTRDVLREGITPIAPASTYARCKDELHGRLRTALAAKGASLCWARLFYPYGEGEHPARLATSLVTRMRAGELVKIMHPKSIKDFIHVDDAASALLKLSESSYDGAVNIGTGTGVAVENFARLLAAYLGRPELVSLPELPQNDSLDFVVADSARIRSFGWQPEVSLEAGLQRLVDRYSV